MINYLLEATAPTTEEVSGIVKLVKEYGMEVCIVAVFILLFIFLLKFVIDSNNKMYDNLAKLQEDTLQMLKNELKGIQTTVDIPKPQNVLEIFVQLDSSIKDIIRDVKTKFDCDRIAVYAFHNGTHASHGFPFFKITCISEQVKRGSGVMPSMKDQIALPLSIFDDSLYDIYKIGHVEVADIETVKDTYPVIYNMAKYDNIKSGSGVAIFSNDNDILGIILVEYKAIKTPEELEKIKEELIEVSSNLAPIMDYSNYQNKN